MHSVLLGIAGIVAIAAISPAQGQSMSTSGFTASSGLGHVQFRSPPPEIGPGRYLPMARGHGGFCSGERCHHVRVDDQVPVNYGYGYGGYYDGDYDANRSFSPDKWNDWWHDRPDRAFPRWMSMNQNCERIWYSGAGWRC